VSGSQVTDVASLDCIRPDTVLISDGRFSDTSATSRYSYYAKGVSVRSRSIDEESKKYVLTTRNNGAIYIGIEENERVITIRLETR